MATRNITKWTISSVEKLISTINNEFLYWPGYIFRGQSQNDWLLEPTLSRILKKLKDDDKEDLIKDHFERFCLEIRGRRGANPKSLTENEIWALGQHYGLHTPLLDWSQSPYVALFFALSRVERSSTGYRTLWAFNSADAARFSKSYKTKKPNEPKWQVEIINPTLDENNRLINQNGLFTKLSYNSDLENFVAHGEELGWISLYKIDFPEELRDKLISYLSLMNINYSTLFPDLTGSSLYSNIQLEQTDFILEQQKKESKKD